MPLSAVEGPYFKSSVARYEQGDILRDVTLVEWADVEEEGSIQITERSLSYCVLLSQDCDLEHDYSNRLNATSATRDKYLQSLLLCPAYPAKDFREGAHLQKMKMQMQKISSEPWKSVIHNSNPRYHFLTAAPDLQVSELVIDFKHYLTVPREVLYRQKFSDCYVATIEIVYRDNLSGRFAHYLSRIGLPELDSL